MMRCASSARRLLEHAEKMAPAYTIDRRARCPISAG